MVYEEQTDKYCQPDTSVSENKDIHHEAPPPYGHSKVVLPSGIVGTVPPRWDVSAEVLHYTESLLSVIILAVIIQKQFVNHKVLFYVNDQGLCFAGNV